MDYNRLISEFGKPKAKIDFIKLKFPSSIKSEIDALHFVKGVTDLGGSIEASKKSHDDWVTIHDPTLQTLQFLLNEYPETEILGLEIALDFKLKDGSNDMPRLVELHRWLKKSVFPQRHERMRHGGHRKYYDASDRRIKRDTLKTLSGNETIYWENPSCYEQVRLYIKTIDNKKLIDRHSVRLEVTLSRGGCQLAGVHHVSLIPQFVKGMRCYISPFLNVAKGIKPELKRTRSKDHLKVLKAATNATKEQARVERYWKRCGSAWAAKHGYRIIPDADTNRVIGSGLKGLQDSLKQLKLTRKVAEYPNYDAWKPA